MKVILCECECFSRLRLYNVNDLAFGSFREKKRLDHSMDGGV